jgi:hypothetical protein
LGLRPDLLPFMRFQGCVKGSGLLVSSMGVRCFSLYLWWEVSMPSKKERIDYLEVQVAGLQDKLSETIRELEELKNRVGNAWLIPSTKPITIPSIWNTGYVYCTICGQYYFPGVLNHVCNPIKVTWTAGTSTIKTSSDDKS